MVIHSYKQSLETMLNIINCWPRESCPAEHNGLNMSAIPVSDSHFATKCAVRTDHVIIHMKGWLVR